MYKKILLYLFCFLFPISVYAQSEDPMILVFERVLPWSMTDISLQFEGNVNIVIDWGGGEMEIADTAGTYVHSSSLENGESVDTVKITGNLTHFKCNGWQTSLRKVLAWGNLGLSDLSQAFANADYLTSVPDSLPKGITNLREMFANATKFNSDISGWDVSNVTDMSYMFFDAESFNSDISNWDVSNVTNMSYMFYYASNFNADISSWDISHVTNISYIFCQARAFKADLSNWDFSNVKNMSGLFAGWDWSSFDLSSLDVSRVTNMRGMFSGCDMSGCDLSGWDVSNVTDMSLMFSFSNLSNCDLSTWNITSVSDMSFMFSAASNFGFISSWDVSNVNNMRGMFYYTSDFNVDLSNWDVSKVTDMSRMFQNAINFTTGLGAWDVSHVTKMDSMFLVAEDFNENINSWDVRNITSMKYMFCRAISFKQDVSGWDISNIEDMSYMFQGVTLPTEIYSDMLINWSKLTLQNNVEFSGGYSIYNNEGAAARRKIIDTYGWQIADGGPDSTVTAVDETLEDGIPTEFALMQNYPNPFNPTTSIEYSIVSTENVTLKVYDLIGQEVMTLVNKVQPAGNYNVTFNASELASGIYVYRLNAGDFISTKKMVLLK